MSVNLTQQGIFNASGEIGANLLAGSYISIKRTTSGSLTGTYTCPDLSKLVAGTKVVVSVDVELYNVASMSRVGVEPSFKRADGTYQYVGRWLSDTTNFKGRISNCVTITADATALGQNGIYIQNITFNTGGYAILSNPKLEIGTSPTPWCPNVNDAIYVGDMHGFNEFATLPSTQPFAKLYENNILATNFIEW